MRTDYADISHKLYRPTLLEYLHFKKVRKAFRKIKKKVIAGLHVFLITFLLASIITTMGAFLCLIFGV